MKTSFIFPLILTLIWSPLSQAYRNCNMECPINFSPSDPSNPLKNYQDRETCLSKCQQDNDQLSELNQQTQEMEEQTELLKRQQEAQEELEAENEELREELEEQRSIIEGIEE